MSNRIISNRKLTREIKTQTIKSIVKAHKELEINFNKEMNTKEEDIRNEEKKESKEYL